MKRHWSYLKYVLVHKWFVLAEGLRLGVPLWQLLIHDWSKFLPDEWLPYARYFRNPDGTPRIRRELTGGFDKASGDGAEKAFFDAAWNRHQKRHPHHWQYWLLNPDRPRARWESREPTPLCGFQIWHDGEHTGVVTGQARGNSNLATEQYDRMEEALEGVLHILNSAPEPLPMPDRYRREMLADWRGAARALGKPDTRGWYLNNRQNIQLHPETRAWIEAQLGITE